MTLTAPPAESTEGSAAAREPIPHHRRTLGGYLLIPVAVGIALLALYLWVNGQELDTAEARRLTMDNIRQTTIEHLQLTIVSTAIVLVIAIPLGVLLTRQLLGRITRPAIAVFNIGQALPTPGILAILAILWTVGFWPVIVGLVAYTVLPVLRNTMVGLQQVDPFVIESARGMGMTRTHVLVRIELPLAVPIMMAGVRTALVINVGTATLAAFVAGGGLGTLIVAGQAAGRPMITVTGAVLAACLALLIDYVAGIAEDVLRPRGL